MLKLKLQYFGHLMQRTDSWKRPWCWKRLKSGGEGDNRGWDGWMASLTWWTWVWVSSGSWWWGGRCAAVRGVAKSRTRLSDWTELNQLKEDRGKGFRSLFGQRECYLLCSFTQIVLRSIGPASVGWCVVCFSNCCTGPLRTFLWVALSTDLTLSKMA